MKNSVLLTVLLVLGLAFSSGCADYANRAG